MSFESSIVWAEPGFLSFGERPGRWRALEEDLAFLRSHGINAIVSLLEDDRNIPEYLKSGFSAAHIPVFDYSAPTPEQMEYCMRILQELYAEKTPVYVHCYAGVGRSGTMAAAWLIRQGMNSVEAIQHVRRLKPGTIETDAQYNFLLGFAAEL